MNSVTEDVLPGEVMFDLNLTNKLTKETLHIKFHKPQCKRSFNADETRHVEIWTVYLQYTLGSTLSETRKIVNSSWLGALMGAVNYLRKKILAENETDWFDDAGQPSWIVLPTPIEISWGYNLFRSIRDFSNQTVAELQATIEKKHDL